MGRNNLRDPVPGRHWVRLLSPPPADGSIRREVPTFSDLLFPLVRNAFNVSLDDGIYEDTFNFFEYLLALLCVDGELLNGKDPPSWAPAGSFVWRKSFSEHVDISRKVQRQLADCGGNWPPLQGGHFGGDIERARRTLEKYEPILESYRRSVH